MKLFGVFDSEEKAVAAYMEVAKDKDYYPENDNNDFQIEPVEINRTYK